MRRVTDLIHLLHAFAKKLRGIFRQSVKQLFKYRFHPLRVVGSGRNDAVIEIQYPPRPAGIGFIQILFNLGGHGVHDNINGVADFTQQLRVLGAICQF